MANVTKVDQAPASAEVIEQNIRRLVDKGKTCDLWVANQFGAPGPGLKVKAQSPVPMRTVWAEAGRGDGLLDVHHGRRTGSDCVPLSAAAQAAA